MPKKLMSFLRFWGVGRQFADNYQVEGTLLFDVLETAGGIINKTGQEF